jgi:signal transduction histidine kinase
MPDQAANNRMKMVAELAGRIADADAGDPIEATVESAQKLLGADFAAYFEYRADENEIVLRVRRGLSTRDLHLPVVGTGPASLASFALLSGEPVAIADFAAERRFAVPAPLGEQGVRSGLLAAVPDAESPRGLLAVFSKERRQHSDDDAATLGLLARMLALALRPRVGEILGTRGPVSNTDTGVAAKMNAIARLAGGVAHDFNDLLTIVSSYTELLSETIEPGHALAEQVAEIQDAARRATSLTGKLLDLSRYQPSTATTTELNGVLLQMEAMLQHLVGNKVQLHVRCAREPLPVQLDPQQIERITLNLVLNARDAIREAGHIEIATEKEQGRSRGEASEAARLIVKDDGEGMDANVQGHLFEPFFTTKEAGGGLGLAIVYALVRQINGEIEIESASRRGTTVRLKLPISDAKEEEAPRPQLQVVGAASETVLLAEDDEAVRRLIRKVLLAKGYTLLEASNGDEGAQLAESFAGPIHLLLTDIVMPGVGGRELADRVRKSHPECRILYISGYTDDAVVRGGMMASNTAFLQKPFTPETLARCVREVLQ